MVTIQIVCRHCGSENIIRNGMTSNSKQRFFCKDCSKNSREDPQPNGYDEKRKEEILRAYQERSSLRGLSRTFGVSRNTVTSWLKKKFHVLPELSKTLQEPDPSDPEATTLELDELWSFVLKKARKRWVWLALCRKSRQVVAFYIGDRSEQSCRELWERVPEAYRGGHCYSDFWKAYREVIPEEQHEAVGKESGETTHIERWNNTLRQRLSRFVRKSLSFSKSDRMHEICLRLFLHRYNLSRLP
ncbi:MAG: IS1 family transposase [Rubrobacter sp.]|nr:IS1 family transposase [Rubrobacter sp.]